MDDHVLPFSNWLSEDLNPDAEQLRDLNLLPKVPWWKKFNDFKNGFNRDFDISDAIGAFEEAVQRYIDKHFTKEEQRTKEFHDGIWRMRNSANDIEEPTPLSDKDWLDWWVTH